MSFAAVYTELENQNAPLANRVRPQTLDDFVGQEHLLATGKLLREMIEHDRICSLILWGPPGVGKTTLAKIIAKQTSANFINFNAVMHGIKEIKEIMEHAATTQSYGNNTIVFIDEIHRFNRAQQDAFLPYVEQGNIILIGATTENPSFEIDSALLSRCKVFILNPLTKEQIVQLLQQTIRQGKAFGSKEIIISLEQLERIALFANGDARSALNTLEMLVLNSESKQKQIIIEESLLNDLLGKRTLYYDKNSEEHYNLISALHKSVRNSDVDSAIYWLVRMLESGEDPLYIARRLIRMASEDIGLTDNSALNLAINTYQACHFLGMPECNVHLVQCVTYLALTTKSNATEVAYFKALEDVQKSINEPVPLHLRNATTNFMQEVGYGKGYQYAHDFPDRMTTMPTRPNNVAQSIYYTPSDQGNEKRINQRLEYLYNWKLKHNTFKTTDDEYDN